MSRDGEVTIKKQGERTYHQKEAELKFIFTAREGRKAVFTHGQFSLV